MPDGFRVNFMKSVGILFLIIFSLLLTNFMIITSSKLVTHILDLYIYLNIKTIVV